MPILLCSVTCGDPLRSISFGGSGGIWHRETTHAFDRAVVSRHILRSLPRRNGDRMARDACDLSCYFSTPVRSAGLASASGFRAAVSMHPSYPRYRLRHRAAVGHEVGPARGSRRSNANIGGCQECGKAIYEPSRSMSPPPSILIDPRRVSRETPRRHCF